MKRNKKPIESRVAWIGECRVGIVFEKNNLMNVSQCATLYANIMLVDYLLHRDCNSTWNTWSRHNDLYMPIDDSHIRDRTHTSLQKHAFAVAKEYFNEIKKNEELENLSTETRATVIMFEGMIEKIIDLNPCPVCAGTGNIIVNEDMLHVYSGTCTNCDGQRTMIPNEINLIRKKLEIYKRSH